MLKYLIVLLNDQSVSICHYNETNKSNKLLPLEDLKRAITFGLKQNLLFQFLLPTSPLPKEYYQIMNEVESVLYTPFNNSEFDIKGCVKVEVPKDSTSNGIILVPMSLTSPFNNIERSLIHLMNNGYQVSIVLKDIEDASAQDLERYSHFLNRMVNYLTNLHFSQKESPLNIITDRIHLKAMNNCNAGVSSITLAPDGNFYLCPAFYYDGVSPLASNTDGIIIPNQHLLKIENSPICSHCDAFQCHRCIYLNKKGTREVNTPTRNQCVIAHLERKASRLLAVNIDWIDEDESIPELSYIDPFEIIQRK